MGKAPAYQFYVNDYLIDTRALSLAGRGAWVDLLCYMWWSSTRGTLTMDWVGYSRLFGATVEQTKAVISEIIDMGVCDCAIEKLSVTKTEIVTQCSKKITLSCRRMVRDEKIRKQNKLRQSRYRHKRNSNASVTAASSSSSSSSCTYNAKALHDNTHGLGAKLFGDYRDLFEQITGIKYQHTPPKRNKLESYDSVIDEFGYDELMKRAELFLKDMNHADKGWRFEFFLSAQGDYAQKITNKNKNKIFEKCILEKLGPSDKCRACDAWDMCPKIGKMRYRDAG